MIACAENLAVKDGAGRTRIEVPSPSVSNAGERTLADAQGRAVGDTSQEEKKKKKRYLRQWYESLGYGFVVKRSLEKCVPGLVEAFEDDVEILVMEKRLGG